MLRRNFFVLTLILLISVVLPSTAFGANTGAIIKVGQNIVVSENENLDAVVSVGGDVEMQGTIRDAVVAIGGDVKINGTVGDAVVVIGGEALIDNEVKGDVVVIGNKAKLSPKALIRGNLVLIGVNLEQEAGAQILGDLTEVSIDEFFVNFPSKFALFGIPLATIILGLVFIGSTMMSLLVLLAGMIFPDGLKRSKAYLLASPVKTFFVGLLLMIFFVPISFVLLITIIGIPLLLLFWLIYGVMAIWGSAVLASLIGEKITVSLGYQGNSHALQLIVGIVLFLIVSQIPLIGWLGILLIKTYALGIGLLSHLGFRQV